MPGLMQFITGIFLFVGLTWFDSFRAPALYMTALVFTAYGAHWLRWAWRAVLVATPGPNVLMSLSFIFLSVLGIIVFFKAARRTGRRPLHRSDPRVHQRLLRQLVRRGSTPPPSSVTARAIELAPPSAASARSGSSTSAPVSG